MNDWRKGENNEIIAVSFIQTPQNPKWIFRNTVPKGQEGFVAKNVEILFISFRLPLLSPHVRIIIQLDWNSVPFA